MSNELDNPWVIIYMLLSVVAGCAIIKLIIENVLENLFGALKSVLILVLPLYLLNLIGYGEYTIHLGTLLLLFLVVRSHKKETESPKREEEPPQDNV